MGNVALRGGIDPIQQLQKALTFHFGHSLPDRLANEIAVTDQTNIGVVDEIKNVLRSVQNGDKTGRTQKLPLRLTALSQDASRGLDTCTEQALDRAVFTSRGRVSELEVSLFDAAPSIKAKREILDLNRFAGKHAIKHRFEDFTRFSAHLHAWLTQR